MPNETAMKDEGEMQDRIRARLADCERLFRAAADAHHVLCSALLAYEQHTNLPFGRAAPVRQTTGATAAALGDAISGLATTHQLLAQLASGITVFGPGDK